MPFTQVMTALWAGMPDVNTTQVVYVFSGVVPCSAITTAGWDATLPTGTQILEMKTFGTATGMYNVTASLTPGPGDAATNYSTSAPTPAEHIGTGGTIVLSAVHAQQDITGTFQISWANGSVMGTFDATYCAQGREP